MERSVRSSGSSLGCCFQGSFTYSSSWCRLATPARSSLVLPLRPPDVQLGAISPSQARTSSLPPSFSSGHRLYTILVSRRYSFILSTYPAHIIWLNFPPCTSVCHASSFLRSPIFVRSTLFTHAMCLSRLLSHTVVARGHYKNVTQCTHMRYACQPNSFPVLPAFPPFYAPVVLTVRHSTLRHQCRLFWLSASPSSIMLTSSMHLSITHSSSQRLTLSPCCGKTRFNSSVASCNSSFYATVARWSAHRSFRAVSLIVTCLLISSITNYKHRRTNDTPSLRPM